MPVKIKSKETLLFVGDSITDVGRRAAHAPLGDGYVKMFDELMTIRDPQKQINIINKGIGGNRITDLCDRWADDVLRHKPDVLSIKIGINDVASYLMEADNFVDAKRFADLYDHILGRVKKNLPKCRILLIEPFYISNEKDIKSKRKQFLDALPAYQKVVRSMSKKYKTKLIKTQVLFEKVLKYREADYLAPEPVHPYRVGHLLMAEAVYSTLSNFIYTSQTV